MRAGIEAANEKEGRDEIEFDETLTGSTIELTSNELLIISDDLTINGLGAEKLTIDAQRNSGIFIDDVLEAGTGGDRFVFNSVNHGVDTIVDFSSDEDLIVVSQSSFGDSLELGLLDSSYLVTIPDLNQLDPNFDVGFVYVENEGSLSYINRSNDLDLTEIAILLEQPSLSSNNLEVV